MRILHMIPDIGISNGVMSVILNYFKAMPKGVYFDVVYFQETQKDRKEDIENLGGRVFKISPPSVKSIFSSEIKDLFLNHKDEWTAVHIHAPHFAVFIAPYAKKCGIDKIVCHCHSTWYSLSPKNESRNKMLALPINKLCSLKLACGTEAGLFWYKHKNNFKVLNNAVDFEHFKFSEDKRNKFRKENNLTDSFVVCHIGRVSPPQKNHPFLLEVFSKIKEKKENAKLLLVGAEKNDELLKLCKSLKIENSVFFLGQRKDTDCILSASDLFVFPSFKEGLPVAAVEAQASSLPVLMSDTITDEVKITDNVYSMSLDESAEKWAEKAIDIANAQRKDSAVFFENSVWNIKNPAKSLYEYYKTGVFKPTPDFPKRILLVFGKMNRGGAETLAMNIFRNIDRQKIMFDFMVHTQNHCDYDDEIKALGGRIYRIEQYNVLNHFKYKKDWDTFLKKHSEYDIVHAHMTGSASVFLPIAKKYGCYVISHSHIAQSQRTFRQKIIDIYRLPLKRISDYMFACSENSGRWMFGKNVDNFENYKVIKNGIDSSQFVFSQDDRENLRKTLGIEDKFVVCNIARFHQQKNHTFLIDIFREIHLKNQNSVLLLAGDGELKYEIEKKVEKLGLKDCVKFLGVRSDIPQILSASDVFLMPSIYEGLPVSLVEAQANSIHIVASDTISQEIKITDLVDMCSLENDAKYWAETVLKYKNGYERVDRTKEISEHGYDIKQTSSFLENFYLNIQL